MWKTLHRGGHRRKEVKSIWVFPPCPLCPLWWRGWTLGLAAEFIVATALQAQPPDLDDLLDKAADYVVGYKHDFVGVVADETYRQDARGAARGTDVRGFPTEPARQKRDLKADVLFVRTPNADFWMQFK